MEIKVMVWNYGRWKNKLDEMRRRLKEEDIDIGIIDKVEGMRRKIDRITKNLELDIDKVTVLVFSVFLFFLFLK